jgi:hypothetical protein
MMAQPLELSYNWRTPVGMAAIGLIICLTVLVRSAPDGWISVAVVLVLLWGVFMLVVWGRTRALIQVDGYQLTTRRFRHSQVLDGRKVASVREQVTGSGPCYKVKLVGDEHSYYVPAALLKKGHSTFFDWLLTYSPDAELDKGSRRTIDQLRTRGLIE